MPKFLNVQTPHTAYEKVAIRLSEQQVTRSPLGILYGKLSQTIEFHRIHKLAIRSLTGELLMEIGKRFGQQKEFATRLSGEGLLSETNVEWFLEFLMDQSSKSRYNTTSVDMLEIAGELLCALNGLPTIEWPIHTPYAAPPNQGRRVLTPA